MSGGEDGRPPRQLPLALPAEAAFGREDFLVGPSNAEAAELFDRWPRWPAPVVVLIGPAGSGKSHLIAAWAGPAGARLIPATAISSVDPVEAIAAGPVAVEDLDRQRTAGADDVALFHLVNAALGGGRLVLSARTPPEAWGIGLPDLASRLRAAARVSLGEPDDELLRRVLVKLFADRQLAVDPSVIAYALPRMERSFSGANALVDRLDREGLARHRPITRAIVADVIAELAGEAGGEAGR